MDNGEEGLHFGLNNAYDAAVIDIMLPGCDGLSVIEQWRKARQTPVIILSAKHSVDDRVAGCRLAGTIISRNRSHFRNCSLGSRP